MSAHRRAVAGLLGALALLGWPPAGSAQAAPTGSGRAALQWVRLSGAEACIAGDALARQVEAKLQREAFPSPREADVLIEGHVERTERGYRAELRMVDREQNLLGSRELSSEQPDCSELSETLVLVLALMIDPEAEAGAREPPPPVNEAPSVPMLAPAPAAAPRRNITQAVGVFARLGVGLLPDIAWGLGAAYELGVSGVGGFRVEGAGYLPERARLPEANQGVELTLAHAELAYCPLWLTWSRSQLAGCLGGQLGMLHSEGYGFVDSRSARALWGAGVAKLRLALQLTRGLELQLAAGLLVPRSADYQAVLQSGATRTLSAGEPLAGSFDVGLGTRF